eukprot:c27726_g1_i2 orf=222-2186(+)
MSLNFAMRIMIRPFTFPRLENRRPEVIRDTAFRNLCGSVAHQKKKNISALSNVHNDFCLMMKPVYEKLRQLKLRNWERDAIMPSMETTVLHKAFISSGNDNFAQQAKGQLLPQFETVTSSKPFQMVKWWSAEVLGIQSQGSDSLTGCKTYEKPGNIMKGVICLAIGCTISPFILGLTQPSVAAFLTDVPVSSQESVELPALPTEFPPLKDFSLPPFEKVVLSNGLRVFLLEDHELGLVGGRLLVKGGGKSDPLEKVGLAAVTSIIQRSGGTIEHPADLLDTKLEGMAARIETSSSVSQMSVGFRCLADDLAEVMSLFSEVIRQPLMPQDKLELARSQFLGAIKRRGDDPESIAAREFPKLLYGSNNIYARYPTADTVASITQEDLLEFHKETFNPKASVLGIWGDFDKSLVKYEIEENLGTWTGIYVEDAEGLLQTTEIGSSTSEPCIYTIDRPGLSQGIVRMGELGTTLTDPDVFALDLLNGILNGFGGLLFDQVRSREALAYSVYGGWTPAVDHRGSFLAGGESQLDSVTMFLQAIKKVLEDVIHMPPTEEMLARAKEGVINSFVFNFSDSGAQLNRIMTYELFDINQDFLFNYKRKVEGITSSEILQAAQRHLHPSSHPVLIVTDVSKLGPSLQSLRMKIKHLQPDYVLNN